MIHICPNSENMGCFPLLVAELDDPELQLENFEPTLRCWYSIFLEKVLALFKVYRVSKNTWSRMETHNPCTNLDIYWSSISSKSLQFANLSNSSMYLLTIRVPYLQS